jgi:hypothetical protein
MILKMKDLYQFINNKNKISYTLKKAYDIGFADSNLYNKKHLAIIHKMKSAITNTYMRNKIVYTEANIDFMNIIPYLNDASSRFRYTSLGSSNENVF